MKVLFVLTSHDQLGNTGRKTGFWLEELAAPYYVFKDAGAEITLASPKGGQPPLDPKSNEPSFQTDQTRRFETDPVSSAQLAMTVKLDSVRQEDFDTAPHRAVAGPVRWSARSGSSHRPTGVARIANLCALCERRRSSTSSLSPRRTRCLTTTRRLFRTAEQLVVR